MKFSDKFSKTAVLDFLKNQFLPDDFSEIPEAVKFSHLSFTPDRIKEIEFIGESSSLALKLYVIRHESENDPRVTLSRETFRVMSGLGARRALVAFHSSASPNWRLSLATIELSLKGAKTKREYSNPRRYSFFLGPDAKTHTPEQFLSKKVSDFDDLLKRFSIEVVNKEFYSEIAIKFTELVGGKRKVKTRVEDFKPALRLPGMDISKPENHIKAQEFAVRLIGRVVFCWFLKKKKSPGGESLLPESVLSSSALAACDKAGDSYYHSVLENLFFQVLNTEMPGRAKEFRKSPYDKIPFLNGGLFEPHDGDFYDFDAVTVCSKHLNTLKIPNAWFKGLIDILEIYNFTIDENTSVDVELAVDPEMLGRIFENLLAEINPETGETARKSTGSYYTPRPIVEYMVDESLKQYLKTKTAIAEDKLADLLSYSESDTDLSESEKEKVISALDGVKIIDPACGSGAFPMGMLQKIVLVLQKADLDSQKWLSKLLDSVPDATAREALRKKLEGEADLWNYTRKLGVIRKSIYGVDIQPIAVEISKLRFFLSLVVDEKVDDKKKNRAIEPLPNLEFKFVCANTLIPLPKETSGLVNQTLQSFKAEQDRLGKEFIAKLNAGKLDFLERSQIQDRLNELAREIKRLSKDEGKLKGGYFELTAEIEKLKELREGYFISSGGGKKKIENLFSEIQKDIFLKTQHAESQSMKLSTWEPFKNKSTAWFDPEWMFGLKGGFDIVIANPPYVGEKGHKEIFRTIRSGSLAEFYQGKMDMFYFFFHRSLDLGHMGSLVAFITTNYYVTATGARTLRGDLFTRAVINRLIDFNELKIFESAQGQHNMIVLLSKFLDKGAVAKNCFTKRIGIATPAVLYGILSGNDKETEYYTVAQRDLYDSDECYIRLAGRSVGAKGGPINQLLNKLSIHKKLNDFCNINSGCDITISKIKESHLKRFKGEFVEGDGVFVLNAREVQGLRLNRNESTRLREFIKNSDINKYGVEVGDTKLIYLKWEDNIEQYPTLKRHLSRFKEILLDQVRRYEEDYPWFALHRAREQRIFDSGGKILVPYRSKSNIFGYSVDKIYSSRDVFYITPKNSLLSLKYLLALLNSKLYYLWLYHRGKRKGEILELYQQPLSEIPVKQTSVPDQHLFVALVDQIVTAKMHNPNADTTGLEQKIDQHVYKLYGLTAEEIKIVENSMDNR